MNRPHTMRATLRLLGVVAAAMALSISAHAQPFAPPAARDNPEAMIAGMLQAAKARLNLDSSQQQAWDNAVAQSKAAHQTIGANRQRLHDMAEVELAKPEPDLAALAALADQIHQTNHDAHVAARNEWLKLYAMLSPEQKAVVRDGIAARVARMEQFRERMREHFRQRLPGNG